MPTQGARQLTLATRVALGAMALIVLTALGMMTLLSANERADILASRQMLLDATARSDAARLRQEIEDLRKDVLFLAKMPPVQNIIQAARNKGVDPRDANSLNTWKGRLQDIFGAFVEGHREYLQIRYIGVADRGREIVRVNVLDGHAATAAPAELLQKGDSDYFQAALKLKAGEVHLSEINLNREHGKIQIPHTPVLRAVTPVFGPDGAVFGVIAINLDFGYLAQNLATSLTTEATVHLANADGDYLVHPAPGRSFGFEHGRRHRWQDEFPGLQVQPAATTGSQTPLQTLQTAGGMVYAMARQVSIDPLRPGRHLLLIYSFPETAVQAQLARARQPMLVGVGISGLLILVLLLWLVRRTFAPLDRLTQAAQAIAAGRYDVTLPASGAGELGTLLRSFRAMQESIALRDEENRVIVETSIDGFWMTDKDGSILDVNDAYVRLSGYAREELLTMRVAELKANEDPDQVRLNMLEARRIGSYRFESDHRRKDGTIWPVEATVTYWPIGEGRYFAFLRDISERKAAELNRRERMSLMRSVMDALRTSIAVLDRQGMIIGVNAAWSDFAAANAAPDVLSSGVGLDYFAACRNAAITDPIAAETLAGLEAVRDGRLDAFTIEYPCHSPTTQRWFIMLARPLGRAEGGMVISHFDITERKLAESAIRRDREQQEVLRRILEIILKGETVEVTLTRVLQILLSVSWLSLLPRGGVFRMEQDGSGLRLIVAHKLPPEVVRQCAHIALGHCHCGKAAATGKVQYARHVDGGAAVVYPDMTDHAHYCVPIASGARQLGVLTLYLPVDARRDPYNEEFLASVANVLASYMLRAEAEQALIAHREDLETAVKARTAELQTSEARARALLATMLDGVVHIDANGMILSVNQATADMFGYEEDQLVGRNVSMLMPEPHASAHDGYLHRYAQTRQAHVVGQRREVEGRRQDGSLFEVELAVNEMVDDVGSTFIGVIRDMTAQKAAEHELQAALDAARTAAQAKSRFLANMSHEIRTPLNAVLGLAQIGMRDGAGSPAGTTFTRIADAGEHLLGVINDVLDASKIEAGKLTVERRPFALHAVIDSVVSFVASRAEAKGLSLVVSLARGLPAWVEGDGLRLAQILTNLLANAIKFTASGEVRLRVGSDGDDMYFRISDTGIGMNPEQMTRLFHPFEQADSSTTRTFGGTGLGLSISLDLARLMGGDINADSRPGAGSSFLLRLRLPAVAAPEHPAGLPLANGLRLSGVSVLAADDVEMNRLILEDLLVHEGAHVVLAENGLEALEQLERGGVTAFDVVLMDVQMPVMDGFEATHRIRTFAPALPVIGVTAHALAEERENCLVAGMTDVVTKPINMDTLVETIRRQVPTRRQRVADHKAAEAPRPPAPPSASPDASAVDWPALLARFNGRHEFVRKLAVSVLGHHTDTPAKLRAAARQADREALTFIAHSLKGVSGNLDARRLNELAKTVEAAMRAGEDIAIESVDALAEAVEAVLAELEQSDQHMGAS